VAIKILLLEDDRLFNETLQDFLEEEGFDVLGVYDPHSALDRSYESNFDIYLFDINLPFESGIELLGQLRESGDNTPSIFLTSRDDKESLVEGFLSGADDYMQKPIDLDELLLRIHAIFRRESRSSKVKIGPYSLDMEAKVVTNNIGDEVDINRKSVELLCFLLRAKGGVVSIQSIKRELWSPSQKASEGSIRVYISNIKKLFPDAIRNIRGIGYRFDMREVI